MGGGRSEVKDGLQWDWDQGITLVLVLLAWSVLPLSRPVHPITQSLTSSLLSNKATTGQDSSEGATERHKLPLQVVTAMSHSWRPVKGCPVCVCQCSLGLERVKHSHVCIMMQLSEVEINIHVHVGVAWHSDESQCLAETQATLLPLFLPSSPSPTPPPPPPPPQTLPPPSRSELCP